MAVGWGARAIRYPSRRNTTMTHDAGVPVRSGDVTIRAVETGDTAAIATLRKPLRVPHDARGLPLRGPDAPLPGARAAARP
jgi:hypothetical protein